MTSEVALGPPSDRAMTSLHAWAVGPSRQGRLRGRRTREISRNINLLKAKSERKQWSSYAHQAWK